jgi:hypothetical protein
MMFDLALIVDMLQIFNEWTQVYLLLFCDHALALISIRGDEQYNATGKAPSSDHLPCLDSMVYHCNLNPCLYH